MTTVGKVDATVTGKIESIDGDVLVLSLSGTKYKTHFTVEGGAASIDTPPGRRIKGTIHARALRMHTAAGGGLFIEPVYGSPRIVQGRVIGVDAENDRVLVDVVVPMWVTVHEDQSATDFELHSLLNCYLQSGTTFSPAKE